MADKFERFRLGISLAHLVPGAELIFVCKDEREYRVSDHPSAEFSLCEIRRMVASSSCPSRPDFTKWIKEFYITGAIEDYGGGIYRGIEEEKNTRWFSTTLRPEIVYEILDKADIDGICSVPVDATLTPDLILGVTTVRISVDVDIPEETLNELVLVGYSSCLVKETSFFLMENSGCESSSRQKKHSTTREDSL